MISAMLVVLLISFSGIAHAAQTAPGNASFDHMKTGFILKDVHAILKCEQCHVDAIFKNTPKDCAGCHSIGTRVGAQPKPINHVPTTSACDTCHISAANFLVKSFSHVGVTGACSTCHNGQSMGVVSKPLNHFPTLLPCETCHKNTSTFLSWSMDHTGITTGCGTCHQGQFPGVVGLPPLHIPIPAGVDCGTCHATPPSGALGSFLGAKYDHFIASPPVAGNCNSCHTGQYTLYGVRGMSATHIPTAGAQCDTCHTQTNTAGYTSFLGATYLHTTANTAVCGTCHQSQYAGVVSINPTVHIPQSSANACDACHTSTTSFLGVTFHTTAAGTAPSGTCATCHNGAYVSQNASPKGTAHIPTTADCGTCHTAANTSAFTTFFGVTFHTTSAGTAPTGTCATCHNGAYVSQSASAKSATHLPTTDDCGTCHTASNTSAYTTFLNVKYHQTTSGAAPTARCDSCHNGSYVASGALPKTTSHLATTADCVVCHTAANTQSYTTFLGASFSHTPGVYASFPTIAPATPACGSCHNGSTALGKAAGHVSTTADCITCHTNATTSCPNCLTFYGVAYSHTNATIGVAPYGATFPAAGSTPTPRCDSCHNGAVLFASGKNTGHVSTTADCITCHTPASTGCGTTGSCSTFLGATFNHTGITAACSSCHQGGTVAGTVQINPAIHIPLPTGATCDQCHTNAITGLPASATPTFLNVKYHPGNIGLTTCTTCHSGAYASQNAQGKGAAHVATTADCVTCHTATNTSNYTTFLGAAFAHTPGAYAAFPAAAPASPLCGSCHNGTTAKGMSVGHVSTTADCITCHTNTSTGCPSCSTFLGAIFAHTPGVYAAFPATAPASPLCGSCHNGTTAKGKSAGHLATTADCNTCHTNSGTGCPNCSTFLGAGAAPHTTAFLGANTCSSCHNGTTATGLSANPSHIPVGAVQCDQCHPAYDGVSTVNFGTAAKIAAGIGGVAQKYAMNHAAVTGRCDSCHNGSYTSQGLYGALPKVTTHIPTTIISTAANTDCTSCHSTTITVASGAADWATGEKMNHNNAQGGSPNYCVTCHLTGVTYMGTMQKMKHNGASTTKDCSSSSCHKPLGSKGTAYSSWK